MSTNVTKFVSIGLFVVAVGLAFYLVNTIKYDIDQVERIKTGEVQVIERLKLIREAELVYLEVKGQFTSDWDKLISFIDTGTYYIIETREEVITLDYGADSSVFHKDTLGAIPAREKIFQQTNYINSSNNGVFIRYDIGVGDMVDIGSKVYTLQLPALNKVNTFTSAVKGTVTNIAPFQANQELSKGEVLITLLESKFDPDTDINDLPTIPGGGGEKFMIWADRINKSGVMVDVIEVVDTAPINPGRRESNEIHNQKPLRFGSRTDVTFSGNWE